MAAAAATAATWVVLLLLAAATRAGGAATGASAGGPAGGAAAGAGAGAPPGQGNATDGSAGAPASSAGASAPGGGSLGGSLGGLGSLSGLGSLGSLGSLGNLGSLGAGSSGGGGAGGAGGGSGILNLSPTYGRCEEITIPMCRGIGYNLTSMPNELNQDTQEEAGLEVHQFWPLVEIGCSPDLKFFLCSLYAPICLPDYHESVPPCRPVCERARAGCEPIMSEYSFPWPERMACDRLPYVTERICMDQNNRTDGEGPMAGPPQVPTATRRPFGPPPVPPQTPARCKPGKGGKGCPPTPSSPAMPIPGVVPGAGPPGMGMGLPPRAECACRCRAPLVPIERDSTAYNRNISVAGVENCAFPCRGVFFSQEEKDFAEVWIALWSGLCAVSTLMTLTTFLIEPQRFKYPERPIVFLSACYLLVSIGYLIRVGLGHEEVACERRMIRYSAQGPVVCTFVFLLVYYFGMASSIWWVVLSLTWFLAAGLKWGNEAIASYSQYFHLAAWLVPTVKAGAVIVLSAVDGDPVAGICYVGNQNAEYLRVFVLAPLLAYLLLGTSFLLGGFVSLFRIRSVIKQQGGIGGRSKADKLEKLMIRIGIFSVLYTVPATIVIGCHLYESSLFTDWMRPLACACNGAPPAPRPLYSVLMLKYFMALAVGITSGVWIWSGKTLDSWRRLWWRITGSSHGRGPRHHATAVLMSKQPVPPPPPPPPGPPPPLGAALLPAPHVTPSLHSSLYLKQQPLSHV